MADDGSKKAADPHSAGGAAGDRKPAARRRRRRRPRRNSNKSGNAAAAAAANQQPSADAASTNETEKGAAGGNNNNNNNNHPDANRSRSSPKSSHHRNRRRNKTNKKNTQTTTKVSSVETNEAKKSGGGNNSSNKNEPYPPHWTLEECLTRYHHQNATAAASTHSTDDSPAPVVIRGRLRVPPGRGAASSFVACDRGSLPRDCLVEGGLWHRNRALDGDWVFVELLPPAATTTVDDGDGDDDNQKQTVEEHELSQRLQREARISENDDDSDSEAVDIDLDVDVDNVDGDVDDDDAPPRTWQDDEMQMDLWNPQVTVVRQERLPRNQNKQSSQPEPPPQRKGRVVHVLPPKSVLSELEPDSTTSSSSSSSSRAPRRRLVGSLLVLNSGTVLLTPNNRSLPQFKCPQQKTRELIQQLEREQQQHQQQGRGQSADDDEEEEELPLLEKTLFRAEYVYGSWQASHKQWPPCIHVEKLGEVGDVEDEIAALLGEFQVDHGEFPPQALKDVDRAVRSGVYQDAHTQELGWKPTPAMYRGRRDYRHQRIFTIDPTTAKDLDDALHITELPDGTIEVGVHIADVSYFVRPDTAVDREALRRATTVYLVDRTIPMLPRPLCEVACSLNENVERLAFSCVWRMNADGTLRMKKRKNGGQKKEEEDVWYGRTVIRSCARLDYATAQNIIDGKLAAPTPEDTPEDVWPTSRRPTAGGHTMAQVAADVRLMHRVALARRRLRFENGALALDSVKLTFQLAAEGQTPLLAAPYPIRDSNRLVEEYMLLANYLVAQRLITHAKERACLRFHPPPLLDSLDRVAAVAKAGMGFLLDYSSSEELHKSLVRFGRVCDDPLVLKCVTQMLTLPMQQAQYFCAGTQPPELWRHFALNMPYYTHFTSPIRRYPDVIVHRLLQATIDDTVEDFPQNVQQIQLVCDHCSEKQKASKEAQTRCDRVFLSLYLRTHPLQSELGIVLSVGAKAFTVYIPSLGADALLYLDEHKDVVTWADEVQRDGTRRILVKQKPEAPGPHWETLDVRVFTRVRVTVVSKDKPPIDIKLRLEGPWERQGTITI